MPSYNGLSSIWTCHNPKYDFTYAFWNRSCKTMYMYANVGGGYIGPMHGYNVENHSHLHLPLPNVGSSSKKLIPPSLVSNGGFPRVIMPSPPRRLVWRWDYAIGGSRGGMGQTKITNSYLLMEIGCSQTSSLCMFLLLLGWGGARGGGPDPFETILLYRP